MNLDLSSFQKALASLDEAIKAYQANSSNDFIRDACIQRFEFSYELAWKMLRRYLKENSPTETRINELNFQSLIRLGSDQGLLKNGWNSWKIYRQARNNTSHNYNEAISQEVIQQIPAFYVDANYLLDKLKKKNES